MITPQEIINLTPKASLWVEEQGGGIAELLNQYIKEYIYYGYDRIPLEIAARTMEAYLTNK